MGSINLEKAPKGMMYALYTDRVVYEKFDGNITELDDDKLLELHIFDKTTEFRVVNTNGYGRIEKVISDSEQFFDDTYVETVLTETGKVSILNYIQFDENDLLSIVNYRLMEE